MSPDTLLANNRQRRGGVDRTTLGGIWIPFSLKPSSSSLNFLFRFFFVFLSCLSFVFVHTMQESRPLMQAEGVAVGGSIKSLYQWSIYPTEVLNL